MLNAGTAYKNQGAQFAHNAANNAYVMHLVSETEEGGTSKAARPSRIVDQITTETDKKFELVARMADAIVETTLEMGSCEEQVLHAKGFSRQDTLALWHFANALAAVELKCRSNGVGSSSEREVHYA